MLDAITRPLKNQILAPLAAPLANVHPNFISILGFLTGAYTAWLAYQGQYVAAFFVWGLSRTLDGFDGVVARAHQKQSDFGGYLDILLDFIVYILVPVGIALATPTQPMLIATIALISIFYVNGASWMYLSAILEKRAQGAQVRGETTTVSMPAGLIGGSETVLFYALFLLLPQYQVHLFWLMGGLVIVGIVQRFVWAIQNLEG